MLALVSKIGLHLQKTEEEEADDVLATVSDLVKATHQMQEGGKIFADQYYSVYGGGRV